MKKDINRSFLADVTRNLKLSDIELAMFSLLLEKEFVLSLRMDTSKLKTCAIYIEGRTYTSLLFPPGTKEAFYAWFRVEYWPHAKVSKENIKSLFKENIR